MQVLVAVKRVPLTGGRIVLTADGQEMDTRYLGFAVSPHEECAVEEAVRLVEAQGGSSAVLTLGPAAAEEQLRDAMAIGIDRAILLQADGGEWDPGATAAAITDAIRAQEAANGPFDLILFGNEAADTGDFQVAIRVAVALDRPCLSGLKGLTVADGAPAGPARGGGRRLGDVRRAPAGRGQRQGGHQPAALPVRARPPAGAHARRWRSCCPRLGPAGLVKLGLRVPVEQRAAVEILGRGADAAPAVVDMLERIGVLDA